MKTAGVFFLIPLFTATLVAANHLRAGNIDFAIKIALTGVGIQLLVFVAFCCGLQDNYVDASLALERVTSRAAWGGMGYNKVA